MGVSDDWSGWDHELCRVNCALDPTEENLRGKGYEERDGQTNMAREETKKQTEQDMKRQRVKTANDKTTSALYFCKATTTVGKSNSQNDMSGIGPYDRSINAAGGNDVEKRIVIETAREIWEMDEVRKKLTRSDL